MDIRRTTIPAEFYQRAEPFLMALEVRHNLILGTTARLVKYPDRYPDPYLATIEDGGEVTGVVMRTPPYNAVLSEGLDTPEAIALAVDALRQAYGTLPGVLGPTASSRAFAEQWQAATGQPCHLHMAERIYELTGVTPPDGVSGSLRRIEPADSDLLVRWLSAFNREARIETEGVDYAEIVGRYLALPTSEVPGLYLWEDSHPVSMAGAGRPTPNGMSVNAVYTPPEHRRRGYASACVAALSQRILDSGLRFCCLFTDLSNPTSNSIYMRMGYRPVCDVDQYAFGPAE
jgi:hypothetical protein